MFGRRVSTAQAQDIDRSLMTTVPCPKFLGKKWYDLVCCARKPQGDG